jgi:hypothetical protein
VFDANFPPRAALAKTTMLRREGGGLAGGQVVVLFQSQRGEQGRRRALGKGAEDRSGVRRVR